MRAFVVASGLRISPFGDLARDMPVGGVPLREHARSVLEAAGLEVVEVDRLDDVPHDHRRLVTYDNVFFSRRVLKSFLSRWRRAGFRPSRVALPASSTLVREFADLQDFDIEGTHALFNLFALPDGASVDAAEPLPVSYREKIVEYRAPKHLTGIALWPHPITSSVCFHVRHWLHVLQLNRLAIQIRWVDEILSHPFWAGCVALRTLAPGRGRWFWRLAAHANRIGRGVDIHPTAIVEGSFIGDGVRIGPQAIVRASIVGPGSHLEERVNISYSVVGARCFVSKNSVVYASVSMDDSDLGMTGMQMCLVGRRAALTPRATPTDVLFGRKLRVKDGDRLAELDLPLLGSCFGHDTYIGADLYIAPGREIPNGTRIGPRPERVLSSIPDGLDPNRTYVIEQGRLVER